MSGISLTNNNGGIVPANPDIEYIQGNDGIDVGPNPTTHIVLLLGDNTQGVDTSGNAGTYTETISMFDATTGQKGVVLLASNAETIAGAVTTKATTPDDIKAKLGAQTAHGLAYGAGQTAAVAWLGEAADGQIPIGQTGGVPVLANITSSDGSVTITNGAGTIDLSVQGELSGTATTIDAATGDVITIPLGATPGTYTFDCKIAGFTTAGGTLSAGYTIVGSVRTTGAAAVLVPGQAVDAFEEGALSASNGSLVVSANNAIFRVTGTLGYTIDWKGVVEFVLQT